SVKLFPEIVIGGPQHMVKAAKIRIATGCFGPAAHCGGDIANQVPFGLNEIAWRIVESFRFRAAPTVLAKHPPTDDCGCEFERPRSVLQVTCFLFEFL